MREVAMAVHESTTVQYADDTGVPTGRVGLWWFLASEILIFGGLIVSYILLRLNHPEWAVEASHTINAAGALNTVVLLTSSLLIVLAHDAASKQQLDRAAKLMNFTVLLGLVFLGVKAFEYTHEI